MLSQLIIGLLALPVIYLLIAIFYNFFLINYVHFKFKKELKGFKIAEGFSPLNGHLISLIYRPFLLHEFAQLTKKYGKTFGFLWCNHRAVFTHDLDLIRRVIVDEQSTNRMQANAPLKEARYDSIFLSNGDQWRRIRRAVASALKSNKFKAPNCLREIEGSINKLVDAIEWRFAQTNGQTDRIEVDIYDLAHRYAIDLALSCLYKQNKVIDFYSEHDFMTKTVDDGLFAVMWNPIIRYALAFPMLNSIGDWFMLHFHVQGTWRKMLMDFIKQQTKISFEARIQIKRAKDSGQALDEDNFFLNDGSKFSRGLIDSMIDHYYEGKLTQREYFHSTWSLMTAADKTSADGIMHTLYQLAINQQVQEKLRKSIELHGFESEYLAWVINESLRLLPPAVLGCARVIERDIRLDNGNVIPANTAVITPCYSIHRLEEYWGPDAEQFKPDRFANSDNFHPFQYIPFGAGPRMCPGKDFALYEMKRLLCTLLTKYKFECKPIEQRYSAPVFTFVLHETKIIIGITKIQ